MGDPEHLSARLSPLLIGDTPPPSADLLTLFDDAPFGVFLVDSDFRLRLANEAFSAMFAEGMPLLGRDFADVVRSAWPEPIASEQIGLSLLRSLAIGDVACDRRGPHDVAGRVLDR